MEWTEGNFTITDRRDAVSMDFVVPALRSTYWAEERPESLIGTSFENSVVLTVMDGVKPVGFARIVSDFSCFAWICDVYIDPPYRRRGLGKFLMSCVKAHPSTGVRMTVLATKDAHGLYEQYGFERREMMFCKKEYGEIAVE